jgi:peptidoglycan/LPS O-acetylase OafA/YrhL
MKNNFNLIRLAMSLTVMFSHSFALVGSRLRFETDFTMPWGTGIGGLAVHVFFAISGYLITGSFIRTPCFPVFIVHRALRLLPALVGAILLSSWAWDHYGGYATNPSVAFNAPLWTLGWEAYCYIAVGVLGVLGMLTRQNYNIIFTVLILHYVWRFADGAEPSFKGIEPMMLFFAMGAFIRLNEDFINMRRAALIGAALTFAAFAPFIYKPVLWVVHSISQVYVFRISDWHLHTSAYIFSAPFFIIYLGRYAKTLLDLKTDISYGVYIYSWPVGEILVSEARRHGFHINGVGLFAASLPIVLLLAFASCKLVEEPALKLKKYFGKTAGHMPAEAPSSIAT